MPNQTVSIHGKYDRIAFLDKRNLIETIDLSGVTYKEKGKWKYREDRLKEINRCIKHFGDREANSSRIDKRHVVKLRSRRISNYHHIIFLEENQEPSYDILEVCATPQFKLLKKDEIENNVTPDSILRMLYREEMDVFTDLNIKSEAFDAYMYKDEEYEAYAGDGVVITGNSEENPMFCIDIYFNHVDYIDEILEF